MLGTLLVFCASLWAILWYLTYDNNRDNLNDHETGKQEQHPALGKKRSRKKHGGKKPGSTVQQATPKATNTDGNTNMRGESVRSLERRERRELEAKEWPKLGATEEKEGAEDLAALHASMLRAAKHSEAAAAEGNERAIRARRQSGRITVGDKVDARFGGGTSFFPAVVTKTHYGGLVNLLYDDGERENKVPLSLVRMQGRYDAPKPAESDDSDSDSDATHGFPRHSGRVYHGSRKGSDRGDGWEVITQKPRKTSQQREEARVEASSNVKNRLKRQKKREKEIAAREALRKKI